MWGGTCVCVCVCVLTHHSSVSVCVIIAGGEGDGGESSCRINTHCNYYAPFALVHMLLLPWDQLLSLSDRANVRSKPLFSGEQSAARIAKPLNLDPGDVISCEKIPEWPPGASALGVGAWPHVGDLRVNRRLQCISRGETTNSPAGRRRCWFGNN